VDAAHPRRALLLVDFQQDFLADDGRMPVARDQIGPVLAAARAAISQAQRDGDLIVKIGNEFRADSSRRAALRRLARLGAGRPDAGTAEHS
jgi:nicotinamidase-related amidase